MKICMCNHHCCNTKSMLTSMQILLPWDYEILHLWIHLDFQQFCIHFISVASLHHLCLLFADAKECRSAGPAMNYRGTAQKTASGRTCQRWDKQAPHKHTRTNPSKFPDSSLEEANNYCRNPDNMSGGPWCYTTDKEKRWEYCSIPICDSSKLSIQFWRSGIVDMQHRLWLRLGNHCQFPLQALGLYWSNVSWYPG